MPLTSLPQEPASERKQGVTAKTLTGSVGFVQGAVHEVAEVGRLRRADEEERQRLFDVVGLDLVDLVAALGEVGGAEEGALADQQRRDDRLCSRGAAARL